MVTVRIMVPKGELTFRQLRRIAGLAEIYGDQRLYTTNRQNLELHGVDPGKVSSLKAEIDALGFTTVGLGGLRDIVSCVGTTYCPKAVARTRDLHELLAPVVAQSKYDAIQYGAIANITGCPNSCSPYRVSDLGFSGRRIREELGSVEGYEVLIGGTEQQHGTLLGEFKRDDIPAVVEAVLDTFVALRLEDESLATCVARVGIEPFTREVYGT
jgi:sulfite reductase (NADPH) hemoprotein beta-component